MIFFLLVLIKTINKSSNRNNNTRHNNHENTFTLEDIKKIINDSYSQLISDLSGIIRSYLSDIRSDIAALSSKMDNHYNLQKSQYAKNSSHHSTGIIKIEPCFSEGNCFASGNLVNINSSLYFSTCRHVIMKMNQFIHQISFIQLYKGPRIESEGPIYIFQNTSKFYDYALIKIKETDELFSRATKISNKSAFLSDIIQGIFYRDINVVYMEGKVVEIELNQMNILQSDCDCTHSFSGGGYFDELGELKVIHKGCDDFLEEDDFSNLDDSMTTVLDATLFYDLISNKTNGTMIVYQGNNITNINETIHVINISNQTDNKFT